MQQYKKILGKVMMTAEDVWNIDKIYDPISLVTDEETNKSYISRKDVPAGIQINNREYWQPVASSGIIDNGVIILNRKNKDGQIPIYDLKSAAESVAIGDRRAGVILGFLGFNAETDTVPSWKLYQYNDVSPSNWTNIQYWLPMDYTNKYAGWYDDVQSLYDTYPFPKVGMYAYVGNSAINAIVYRCYEDRVWAPTEDKAFSGVVNLADEEDITSKQNKLKFKDKEYNPAQYNGLGRIYLRKNMVDGKNIFTQEMIEAANTIYIIQYDYDLQGQTITISEGCTLDFQGGSFTNGTIVGNNTFISSRPYCIFNNINLLNTFDTDYWYLEWFSIKDYCSSFDALYNLEFPKTIKLIKNEYVITRQISLNSYTILDGNNCIIRTDFPDYYSYAIYLNSIKNVTIKYLTINQSEIQDCQNNLLEGGYALNKRAQIIFANDVDNLCIKNCTFYYFGASAIAVDSIERKEGNLRIDSCDFYFRRGNANYDSSTIYAAGTTNIITNNYINGRYAIDDNSKSTQPSYGGIELHSPNSILTNNNIINCGNAINITPGEYYSDFLKWKGFNISNNIIGRCSKGIVYWCFGSFEHTNDYSGNLNIVGNVINIGPDGNSALNAIGIIDDSNGTLYNVNVSNNIIEYTSKAAYHTNIIQAPGINFSGACKISNLVIDNNTIRNSPANAIVVNHTSEYRCDNVKITNNNIVNCRYVTGQSIPSTESYHYPISVVNCDSVSIENNKFHYSGTAMDMYGLYYIYDCTLVTVLNNRYVNTSNTKHGGIKTNCITQIFTDDIVTKAVFYNDSPYSFVSNLRIYKETDYCQLFIGDKLLTSENTFKTAIDIYNNGEDYYFKGSATANGKVIWVNRIPPFLTLGLVVKMNDNKYVVSYICEDIKCIYLYDYIGDGNTYDIEAYKGTLISDATLEEV